MRGRLGDSMVDLCTCVMGRFDWSRNRDFLRTWLVALELLHVLGIALVLAVAIGNERGRLSCPHS